MVQDYRLEWLQILHTALVAFVNQTLLDMEKSGEAKRIFDKWFGPKSEAPLKRDFVISAARWSKRRFCSWPDIISFVISILIG